MALNRDPNHVSVRTWMFIMFIMMIPGLGQLMILVWAVTGHNESRQNFFRALLAWMVIITVVSGLIMWFNLWPIIENNLWPPIEKLLHRWLY